MNKTAMQMPTREEFVEAAWDETRDNWTDSHELYEWLRDNLKPAQPLPSEDELLLATLQVDASKRLEVYRWIKAQMSGGEK